MGFIFDQGNLNVAALTVPGAYVQLIPPVGLAVAGPSNSIAISGTASWGPVNHATGPHGDLTTAQAMYGQFDVNLFRTDKYDMMRAVMQALQQAQTNNALNIWLNRISDGSDTAASVILKDVTTETALNGITLPAKYTGIAGNTIRVLIAAAGGVDNLYNVTLIASFGGQNYTEQFLGIPGSSGANSTFWVNLAMALQNGNGSRGPSQLIGVPTAVSTTAKEPAVGVFLLAGGTDGRGDVEDADHFGSDVIGNRQGIYAFRGLPIVPAYVYCAGLIDDDFAPTIHAFTLSEIVRYVFPLPAGTNSQSAVGARNSAGISDKRFMWGKDWIYWRDPISGQLIFTDPIAVMIGRAASLSPELSPLNKQVYGVVATEHPQPYPPDEIGILNTNGIWAIANPAIGGPYFGFISASTTSLNPIEQPVEYQRLKDYIGIQFASTLGRFVGRKQGPYDPDPTRQACKSDVDSMMVAFWRGELIATAEDGNPGFRSQCDAPLNPPDSVRAGYLRAKLEYLPYSSVKFVVLDLATTASLSAGQAFALAQGG